jgi:hypothetical protein
VWRAHASRARRAAHMRLMACMPWHARTAARTHCAHNPRAHVQSYAARTSHNRGAAVAAWSRGRAGTAATFAHTRRCRTRHPTCHVYKPAGRNPDAKHTHAYVYMIHRKRRTKTQADNEQQRQTARAPARWWRSQLLLRFYARDHNSPCPLRRQRRQRSAQKRRAARRCGCSSTPPRGPHARQPPGPPPPPPPPPPASSRRSRRSAAHHPSWLTGSSRCA